MQPLLSRQHLCNWLIECSPLSYAHSQPCERMLLPQTKLDFKSSVRKYVGNDTWTLAMRSVEWSLSQCWMPSIYANNFPVIASQGFSDNFEFLGVYTSYVNDQTTNPLLVVPSRLLRVKLAPSLHLGVSPLRVCSCSTNSPNLNWIHAFSRQLASFA